MVTILGSALKPGFQEEDILHALNMYVIDYAENEDPRKVVRIGYDSNMRLLEVGFMEEDGYITVFHAMKARRRYLQW
ncbi:toxin [Actinomyces faecalis]|uniref:toxin n=1 Tax=Actinomyces faecalis TaxID=2722820 RepID=UPI001557FA03|nr:toxin [Actinomyces faecalis]